MMIEFKPRGYLVKQCDGRTKVVFIGRDHYNANEEYMANNARTVFAFPITKTIIYG